MFSLLILSRRKIFLFMIKIIMVIRQTKNYITIRIIIIIMYTYIYILYTYSFLYIWFAPCAIAELQRDDFVMKHASRLAHVICNVRTWAGCTI